ncbi:MAG: YegP family protein [Ignavibacteria bacterium]|jgi:uncharacterized protein YegP (UPF0339 family)
MKSEQENITMQKNPVLDKSEDYEFLRAEGIKHIEKLASKIWTDYNTHDPGITIHELLCYAITDLGYRTSNKIADILAEDKDEFKKIEPENTGNIKKKDTTFFTASQILPCNPVSVIDFRKLLVDIEGVKNAWIKKASNTGQPFVPDLVNNKLVYQDSFTNESVELKGLFNIIVEYEDEADVPAVKEKILNKFHRHRNLCEDINEVKDVEYENIGVCAGIEVTNDADIEEVLAEIYYRLNEYFSPSINFYTIEQLLDKGRTIDQIFEGPLLEHGFIDSKELIKAELKDELRVSDMINFIMDIDGVVAVKNMMLSTYEGDQPLKLNNTWKVELSKENLAPQLSLEKSQITFYKESLPYFADNEKVLIKLQELTNLLKKGRLKGHVKDLEDPEGEYYDLDDYYPVQNEFPLVYGIGKHGLRKSATEKRKAQAKQLKAYLLFFEQILANYLSQLTNIKNIFSIDPEINKTYYTQVLSDIRDLDSLFTDFNAYKTDNQKLAEDKKTFLDRRNRVLSHLLSRFCEEITDYSLFMYIFLDERASSKLIEDKIAFLRGSEKIDDNSNLKGYPDFSQNRGRAFNYFDSNFVWDTTNVAGMKKRISGLLGFGNYERKNIATDNVNIVEYDDGDEISYGIRIEIPFEGGSILFTGIIKYDSRECAESALHFVLSHADNLDSYSITTEDEGNCFKLLNDCGEEIVESIPYSDLDTCISERDAVISFFRENCDVENFHVVEHILLRPPDNLYDLLPVCIEQAGKGVSVESMFYFEIYKDKPKKTERKYEWRFRLKDYSGDIVFKSEGYKYKKGCKHGVDIVPMYSVHKKNFEIREAVNGKYYFVLIAANNEIIGMSSDYYELEKDAERMIDRLVEFGINTQKAKQEVKYKDYEIDPYSYRISVIMPSWPEKFRDINFMNFIEKSIRLETPAHIFPRICWIDLEQMRKFEIAYKNWLVSLNSLMQKRALYICAEEGVGKDKLLKELNTLIIEHSIEGNEFAEVLFSLKNIHPVARLHDCQWSEGNDPQVILGHSSLGII